MDKTQAKDGLRAYYKAKIEEHEIAVRDKTQNLRRLEAQRNELNTKGEFAGHSPSSSHEKKKRKKHELVCPARRGRHVVCTRRDGFARAPGRRRLRRSVGSTRRRDLARAMPRTRPSVGPDYSPFFLVFRDLADFFFFRSFPPSLSLSAPFQFECCARRSSCCRSRDRTWGRSSKSWGRRRFSSRYVAPSPPP